MKVLRIARSACLGSVLLALAASSAAAQSHAAPPIQPSGVIPDASNNTSTAPAFGNSGPADPNQAHMMREMAKERGVLRQKEIVDETNQLLDLAKQLKEAVDKTGRDQLSLNVVNTAAEIEKLAKSVKQKMRDGD
ncbi:MAG TPA: hypothetical protein VKT75_01610 [Acidobacteriaceae bacterium]|nr:hypothetical protein [Acidobacteriaceae bacterium]